MNDRYLHHKNVVDRLVEEYHKYGNIIVAYDYDGTVHDYHKNGDTYLNVMNLLKDLKPYAKFIVYTCSPTERYEEIINYLEVYGLPMDTINENIVKLNDNCCAKLYYNIMLDDRCGLESAFFALTDFLEIIKKEEKQQ